MTHSIVLSVILIWQKPSICYLQKGKCTIYTIQSKCLILYFDGQTVCVCMYMCMYVYVCMYMCMCMYVCVCMCMYVYVCIIHLCVGRCYVVCPYDSDKWDFIALERMRPINVHVYHSAIIIVENTKVLQFLQRQQAKSELSNCW